jgi:hypothetical protein
MRTRILLCAGIVAWLAGILEAQDNNWGPVAGSNLWSNVNNWSLGALPTSSNKAKYTTPDECILDIEGAEAKNVDLGGGPLKIVNGGSLTVYDWFIIGYGAEDVGEGAGYLEVHDGGVLNCRMRLYVGREGEGHLTVYEGGTINILGQHLNVANTATGTGVVTLEGGSVNILEGTDSQGLRNTGENASIDFRGGTMNLRDTSANRTYLDTAISAGVVKAYGGVGDVVVDPNETPGTLVIRGIHPLQPFPSDDGRVPPGSLELSWTLPDPLVPGQPVAVDVYFTDNLTALQQFTDPAAIRIVSKKNVTSVVVQTQPKTRYYWAVDTYIGDPNDPIWGPTFSFFADNIPPQVNAGADVTTWLTDGSVEVAMAATVEDTDPTTSLWSVVTEPNESTAVIGDPTQLDTTVTLTAVGTYVLELTADDGEKTGSDTLTINVYGDQCEAAKSLPGWTPIPGDLNLDCVVNDLDLAILQENWLKCNGLDCPEPNQP